MPSTLIRGGRVVDPASGTDRAADVLLEGHRVSRIERGIARADEVLDATDQLVVPGLVDMHVHLRTPGQEHKEDMQSGTAAAAAGGFTTVCCMPNTVPVNDSAAVTAQIVALARERGSVRVVPAGALSVGLRGEQLADHAGMCAAGSVALTDDGRCLMHSGLMRAALERARSLSVPVLQHCEDHGLSGGGAINEGPLARRLGVSSQPPQAESIIVARDVELVQLTGAPYHAQHLSTAASLDHVRRARARGLPVSCEVTPHHLFLSEVDCAGGDPAAKVNPPLRSAADREAVVEAVADGTADAIATDHAPHAAEEKQRPLADAPFGIAGIELALPLCLELWRRGVAPLQRVLAMLSCNPARILGVPGGALHPGGPADVAVIDPELRWTVDPDALRSRGRNTPLAGRPLRGAVIATVVDGKLVYRRDR